VDDPVAVDERGFASTRIRGARPERAATNAAAHGAANAYGAGVDERRLRVAQVITRMIVGGAQETVLLTAALARRDRFEHVIVTGPQTGPEGSLLAEAQRRGVRVVVVPELVRQVHPPSDLRAVVALRRLFADLRVDVVHTHSSKAGIVGRIAAARAGVPRVLHTVHGWPFHAHQPRLASGLWRALERSAARRSDHLVVVAEPDREKGLAAGIGAAGDYVVVRSGVELEMYGTALARRHEVRDRLGLPRDARVLGAVNRLSEQKDPLTLVAAAGRVLRADPAAWLLIVGDGPLRAAVDAGVAREDVADRVVLTGLRYDVPDLLGAMDVFLTTSLWEGLPRTILQAMATGVPVVATSVDGVVDVVDDGVTGLLVEPRNATQAATAVLGCFQNPDAARARAAKAADLLPAFSAQRMVRQLEELYEGR
jgi:glycosyltransferase involved in cell wall biosynthesis